MLKQYNWIFGIFFVALTIRVLAIFFLLSHDPINGLVTGDGAQYLEFSKNIAAGLGYVENTTQGLLPVAYRPPGYSAILALFQYFGFSFKIIAIIQAIISSLIPIGILVFLPKFINNIPPWISKTAALMAALDPLQIFYNVTFVTETFFSLAFLGMVFCLLKWHELDRLRWIVAAGLCLGVSVYLRPVGIYLGLFLTIFILGFSVVKKTLNLRLIKHLVFFLFIFELALLPWQIRNFYKLGDFSFSSLGFINFYVYAAPSTLAIQENQSYDDILTKLTDQAKKEAPDKTRMESLKNKEYALKKSYDIIKNHPAAYLKAYLLGTNNFLFSGNYHFILQRQGLIKPPQEGISFSLILAQRGVAETVRVVFKTIFSVYIILALGGKIIWLIIMLGSLTGGWLNRKSFFGFLFMALMLYFILSNLPMGLATEARHRVMINPLIYSFFLLALSKYIRPISRSGRGIKHD